MTEPIRRDVDFKDSKREVVRAKGYEGKVAFGEPSVDYPGVRFKTWKFEEVDPAQKDGALIEINPGARTPVQIVESKTVFTEVPLSGKLILVNMDSEGQLYAFQFDSDRDGDTSYQFEIGKGEIMCWVSPKDQDVPSEVLEYEEPGFASATLTNIEPGTDKVGEIELPSKLWEMVKQLEEGQTENTVIPIINLN